MRLPDRCRICIGGFIRQEAAVGSRQRVSPHIGSAQNSAFSYVCGCHSDLMDDHQSELAEAMETRGHCLYASNPDEVVSSIQVSPLRCCNQSSRTLSQRIFEFEPKPLPESAVARFAGLVDDEMGFVANSL